jgi:hypothetical protein
MSVALSGVIATGSHGGVAPSIPVSPSTRSGMNPPMTAALSSRPPMFKTTNTANVMSAIMLVVRPGGRVTVGVPC